MDLTRYPNVLHVHTLTLSSARLASLPGIDGPQQVEVKDVTDSSALVVWSRPVVQPDRLTVSYGPSSDSSQRTSVELSPADKQYNIEALSPNTEYEISLTSGRGDMTSEPVLEIFTTGRFRWDLLYYKKNPQIGRAHV